MYEALGNPVCQGLPGCMKSKDPWTGQTTGTYVREKEKLRPRTKPWSKESASKFRRRSTGDIKKEIVSCGVDVYINYEEKKLFWAKKYKEWIVKQCRKVFFQPHWTNYEQHKVYRRPTEEAGSDNA